VTEALVVGVLGLPIAATPKISSGSAKPFDQVERCANVPSTFTLAAAIHRRTRGDRS
jgi:hypothetical protein